MYSTCCSYIYGITTPGQAGWLRIRCWIIVYWVVESLDIGICYLGLQHRLEKVLINYYSYSPKTDTMLLNGPTIKICHADKNKK